MKSQLISFGQNQIFDVSQNNKNKGERKERAFVDLQTHTGSSGLKPQWVLCLFPERELPPVLPPALPPLLWFLLLLAWTSAPPSSSAARSLAGLGEEMLIIYWTANKSRRPVMAEHKNSFASYSWSYHNKCPYRFTYLKYICAHHLCAQITATIHNYVAKGWDWTLVDCDWG